MARLVVNSERPILLSRGTSAGVALTASRSLFRRSSSYGLTSRVLKPISNQCDLLRTATRLKTPSAIRGLYTAQSLTAPSRHPHVRLPRYALPSPVPRPGCSRSTRISRSFRAKASTSCPSCRSRAVSRRLARTGPAVKARLPVPRKRRPPRFPSKRPPLPSGAGKFEPVLRRTRAMSPPV
jgi:hypothetical protein